MDQTHVKVEAAVPSGSEMPSPPRSVADELTIAMLETLLSSDQPCEPESETETRSNVIRVEFSTRMAASWAGGKY